VSVGGGGGAQGLFRVKKGQYPIAGDKNEQGWGSHENEEGDSHF